MEQKQKKKYLLPALAGGAGLLVLFLAFSPVFAMRETNCTDGIDNDNDGQIDDVDDDCDSIPGNPELLCADGLDNDGDGFIDGADSDCTTSPNNCPAWQHREAGVCIPDSATYGIVTGELGLVSEWNAYYNDNDWSVLIENPYYLDHSPPEPKIVKYLTRWVGPDGLIYQEDVSNFAALGGAQDNIHMDRDDEIDLGAGAGFATPVGQWTVYVYMTTEDIGITNVGGVNVADVQGRTLQSLGSTTFTATDTQNAIIKVFCLISPTC